MNLDLYYEDFLFEENAYLCVLFWYFVKVDASVLFCTVAYTGQVTFYNGNTWPYNWSPCSELYLIYATSAHITKYS